MSKSNTLSKIGSIVLNTIAVLTLIFILLLLWTRFTTLQPESVQPEEIVCPADAPKLEAGRAVKVLNWNIQYMASRNYVFWYDIPGNKGPDTVVKEEHVHWTIQAVADVIKAEQPDVILIQELSEDSKNTHHVDQLAELMDKLPPEYACYTDAFYWRSAFNPHPRIAGSADMKLATISKFAISESTRYQLPIIPGSFPEQAYNLKRAVLEVELPVSDGTVLHTLNTHLDAFAQGHNTMEQQIRYVHDMLGDLERQNQAWFMGGDFNLLPPGIDLNDMHPSAHHYYNQNTEIAPLFKDFQSAATQAELNGPDRARFYTHWSNNPEIESPDRTIDYIFYARSLEKLNYRVLQSEEVKQISDHLPLVAEFQLP